MKLAALLLGTLLATTGTAAADDVLRPPGGAVYVSDAPPMQPGPGALPRGPMQRGPGALQRGPGAMQRQQLRRALVETFDVNGDGRLGPRERIRAVRALRRIERRLATPGMAPGARGRAVRGAIRRYDLNGDGNVGPGEMPPAAARKLRRLDRDRDGWVEPGEYE
ncbi:MAG TPA: hypothetical protein VN253_04385 [Kofleriaceae bacterium]|nr:hypothetical protein [Kofleriaceae bacterium]